MKEFKADPNNKYLTEEEQLILFNYLAARNIADIFDDVIQNEYDSKDFYKFAKENRDMSACALHQYWCAY